MKIHTLVALLLVLLLLVPGLAQDEPDAQGNPAFTQQELDRMLAPVALYPDALLSQMLMAATYPLEVVQAARWSRDHGSPKGDAAVQQVGDQDWDPSVKSLVAFPQILRIMDEKIDWTERLGDAFLSQQDQVMDTVQALRRKAQAAGNLKSNAQVDIQNAGDDIIIDYTSPDVVYVPYYDPRLVFGPWWWPGYPPVFWDPWPGYVWTGGFAWGFGIGVGVDFFFGAWDWPHHHLHIRDHRHWFHRPGPGPYPWGHDPHHRHAVPYRNAELNRTFRPAPRPSTPEYRGHEYFPTARPPSVVQPALPSRPTAQPPSVARPALPTRPAPVPSPPARRPVVMPPVFEGVGRGPEVRDSSARGRASLPAPVARPAPPPSPQPGHRH